MTKKKNPNYQPPPEGIAEAPPEATESAAAYGKWLPHPDEATQNYYLWENEEGNDADAAQRAEIRKALEGERNEAFKRGEQLPGVSESGQGTTLDERGRAAALEAKGIRGIDYAAGKVSQSPSDYTYTPDMDKGAGYDLSEQFQYFGANSFDPLAVAAHEKAIDQVRKDTAGVEGQKFSLGEMQKNYAQGGLSAIDRARIAESTRIREAQARGAREAIQANAAEQGRGGGNLSFLLQQKANQDATSGRAMDDLQTQALALQRQDAMLRGISDTGSSIQNAQDIIDHLNAQGQRDVQQREADRENAANERNFEETTGRQRQDAAI